MFSNISGNLWSTVHSLPFMEELNNQAKVEKSVIIYK